MGQSLTVRRVTGLAAVVFALLLPGCRSTPGPRGAGQAAPGPLVVNGAFETYTIRAGDVLGLAVYGRTQLAPLFTQPSLRVSPSGEVVLPVAGPLNVQGLTQRECTEAVRRALAAELKNPVVQLTIEQRTGARFHILGEVRSPGTYELAQRTTSTEAMLMAGGFTQDAARDRVVLVRAGQRAADGEEAGQPAPSARLDFEELLAKADMRADVELCPGDILYVPPTRIARSARFHQHVQSIMSPYLSVLRLAGDVLLINQALGGE